MDGVYSVKAGYRFLVDDEQVSAMNPQLPYQLKSIWSGLWKLKIPNRTKTFLWRAFLNALPTRLNLVKRKVLTEATCQLCGLDQESTLHALWSCPKLVGVWDMHFSSLKGVAIDCVSFLEVFKLCMENALPSDLFAMVASQIWHRRNKLRMGETMADLRLLNSLASELLLEFQHAHPVIPSPLSPRPQPKWEPPPPPNRLVQNQF